MGFFDLFRKKKVDNTPVDDGLTPEERAWRRLVNMWESGSLPSPYSELMTYDVEVKRSGFYGLFMGLGGRGNVARFVSATLSVLGDSWPAAVMKDAHAHYEKYYGEDEEEMKELLEECDYIFIAHEDELLDILRTYASTL